jgi:hypothetical protein
LRLAGGVQVRELFARLLRQIRAAQTVIDNIVTTGSNSAIKAILIGASASLVLSRLTVAEFFSGRD